MTNQLKVVEKGQTRYIDMEVLPPVKAAAPIRLSDPTALPAVQSADLPGLRADDAIKTAQASLLYSKTIMAVIAGGLFGLLFLAWLRWGGDIATYAGLYILLLAGGGLLALVVNRNQGLHHSSTGIAHHQIDSAERVAMYAIDKHAELMEKRWQLESGQNE